MATVEVQSSGKDVGAGESLKGKLSSVGSTTGGYNLAETSCLLDSLTGNVCNVRLIG